DGGSVRAREPEESVASCQGEQRQSGCGRDDRRATPELPADALATASGRVAARYVHTVAGQTRRDTKARWWRAETRRAHRSRPIRPTSGVASASADLRPDVLCPQLRLSAGAVVTSGAS